MRAPSQSRRSAHCLAHTEHLRQFRVYLYVGKTVDNLDNLD